MHLTFFVYLGAIENSWRAVAVGVFAVGFVRTADVAVTLMVVRDRL